MAAPPPEVIEKARDVIARGASKGAVLDFLRADYDVPPDLEAALTGERIVRDAAGRIIYDAATPGQTPRPLGAIEAAAEATKGGIASAVAMPLGAAEQARVGLASVGVPGFGDPNERRVFGQAADRLRQYARARTDEADPRYDLPLALDEILSGVPQGLGALTVAALSGPGFYATVPAMVGGGVYDETGDAGEALKAAGIAGATTLAGLGISRVPTLPGRLAAGAGVDAGIAFGLGQDTEGIAANMVLGLPFNLDYTGARRMDGRRVTPVDPVARQGILDAFGPPAKSATAADETRADLTYFEGRQPERRAVPPALPRPELAPAPETGPVRPVPSGPGPDGPLPAEAGAAPAKAAPEPIAASTRRLVSPLETEIRLAGGGAVRARYAMVEVDDLVASHTPDNFQPRPDYPERVQERLYHSDQAEQAKVVRNADGWLPSYIYNDAPTATTGAPIVTPRNIVLGGNSRTMSPQRIAMGLSRTPARALRDAAVVNAERFGFDREAVREMKNPMLVRVLEDAPTNLDDAAILGRRLNDDDTQEVGSVARGVSLARSLTDRSLRVLQDAVDADAGDAPSLRSALSRNTKIVGALRADGIISDQNQNLYVRKDTGHLTEDGMRLAEDTFLGRVVPDADVLNAMAPAMRARLLRAVPAILHAETAAPEARFARLIDGAVRSEIVRDVTGDTLDDFLAQTSLTPTPSQRDPGVAAIHRALLLPKPTQTRDAFLRFARRAAEVTSGQESLLGGRRTMADAFEEAFGARPTPPLAAGLELYRETIEGAIAGASKRGKTPVAATPEEVALAYERAEAESAARPPTHLIRTPEREAKRAAWADALYQSGGKAGGPPFEPLRERLADVVLGLPASGKSNARVNKIRDLHRSVLIDADEAKILVDEFEGGRGAAQVHEESAQIAEGRVLPRAMDNGDNVVLALVGKNPSKIESILQNLKDTGYQVRLHFVDLPAEKAKQRTVSRFVEDHRFVSIDYLEGVGAGPRKTFNALRHRRDIVDAEEEVSNDVSYGEEPRVVSGRTEAGVSYVGGAGRFGGPPRASDPGGSPPLSGPEGPRGPSGDGQGPPGPSRPGPVGGGPPSGGEGTPGRGFGVDVPPDAEYAGRHSASVLGPDDAAFVDQVLTDPDWGRALEERRGGRITLAEAEALGSRWGMTASEAANLPQRTILPVEGEARLRQLAQAATARVRTTRTELEEAMRSGDARRMETAQTALQVDTREAAKILMAYEAVGSEAGRALGYRSRDSRRTRSELLARRGLRMAMDETLLSPEQRDALAQEIVAAGDNPARLLQAIRSAYLPKWYDKLMELRVNNLVSSPVTITRNVIGNSAGVASRLVENVTGYLVDLPFEGVQRVRGAAGSANRRRAREITADVAGTIHGAIEGARLAWGALRDENVALSQGRIPEEAIRLPALEGRLGVAIRYPTRIQSAADLLFYSMNAEGRRYQLAMRQAVNEGHRGGAATARARELIEASRGVDLAVAERVSRGTLKPKNDAERIAGSAHGYAQEFTFRAQLGKYGQAAEQLRQAPGAAGGTTRLLVTFFRTPVNLAKFAAQRSLAGFFSPRNWRDLTSGDRERATSSVARLGLGTGIAYALGHVALSGAISGAGPEDPAARDALRRTGWLPHSVRIGDTWYSYRGFSPISEQLAAAAELAETWTKNPEGEVDLEALQRIGLAIARTNLNQPMWTGIADIVNAVLQSDDAYGERRTSGVVGNLVTGTVVPRSLAWAARTADPLQRKYGETFLDQMLQQVPGAREITVPFRDPLGRTFETGSGALAAFVPHSSDSRVAPIDRFLVAIQESPDRAVVGYPSRTQLGRRLSPEAFDALLQARGDLLLPVVNEVRKATNLQKPGAELAARKAIGEAVTTLSQAAVLKVVPKAELEALGLPETPASRTAVLAILREPMLRDAYTAPNRTDAEKRQIIETLTRAGSDPAAAATIRSAVLGESMPAPVPPSQPAP